MSKESVRRAVRTFVVATLALFVPGLLGWLNALTEWARAEGATPFPDAKGLMYLATSAITAGVIALVQLVWNMIEDASGKGFLRDVPPRSTTTTTGSEYGQVSAFTLGWGIVLGLGLIATLLLVTGL